MRFFTAALLLSLAQGERINLVPDHVKAAFASKGGAMPLIDGDPSTCKEYRRHSKQVVMFEGAGVGVKYNVKAVRVYFEDFQDVKQAQVYVGSQQCGQIHQHQNVNEGEGWVELTCDMEGGYVWIRGDRDMQVCEIAVYVENLPAIPESWLVLGDKLVTVSQNDGQGSEVAELAVDGVSTGNQWKKDECAMVQIKGYSNIQNNEWEAEFVEPQYVKGVTLFTLIHWSHPASRYVMGANVWVVKEDGEKKRCGSISQGEGGVSAPVNMVWCDEIATKVVVERHRGAENRAPLGLCEVEINAVAVPEEPTEVIDERNQY